MINTVGRELYEKFFKQYTVKQWAHDPSEDPLQHVNETNGLLEEIAEGKDRTDSSVQQQNKALSAERKAEVDDSTLPLNGIISWSDYDSQEVLQDSRKSNGKNRK